MKACILTPLQLRSAVSHEGLCSAGQSKCPSTHTNTHTPQKNFFKTWKLGRKIKTWVNIHANAYTHVGVCGGQRSMVNPQEFFLFYWGGEGQSPEAAWLIRLGTLTRKPFNTVPAFPPPRLQEPPPLAFHMGSDSGPPASLFPLGLQSCPLPSLIYARVWERIFPATRNFRWQLINNIWLPCVNTVIILNRSYDYKTDCRDHRSTETRMLQVQSQIFLGQF